MATSVISLLEKYPETIQQIIDLTFDLTSATGAKYRRGDPDPALQRFIPQTRYAAAKLAFAKLSERRPTLASIVATDGEYPVRREPVELSIETVGSVKLARARLLTEEDFDLLREAEMNMAAGLESVYQAFVDRYIQIPAILTQSVTSLAALLLLQVFATGASAYIDPDTKLGFELSYLDQIPAENRPAALTGTATWTPANVALANAKPLENLRQHLNEYYGISQATGLPTASGGVLMLPEAIAMSGRVAEGMLNANDTKAKIARMKGSLTDSVTITDAVAANLPRPSIADCRDWLRNEITAAAQSSQQMPEFIVSDAVYYTLNSDGRINPTPNPYLPNDSYVFMNEGIVEGAYVPTATNDYASTMALLTEVVSKAPKREKASIDTRFLAMCTDPRMIGFRKVI